MQVFFGGYACIEYHYRRSCTGVDGKLFNHCGKCVAVCYVSFQDRGVLDKPFHIHYQCQHNKFRIFSFFLTPPVLCQLTVRFFSLKVGVGQVIKDDLIL